MATLRYIKLLKVSYLLVPVLYFKGNAAAKVPEVLP